MSFDVDSRQYVAAARAVRAAGATDLKRAYSRALREVARPLGKTVLVVGARSLPKRGGLAARVATAKVGVQASSLRATVSLKTREGYDLTAMSRGDLRHPVFARQGGGTRAWVRQRVNGGGFQQAFEANAGSVRKAMLQAGQDVLDNVKAAVE